MRADHQHEAEKRGDRRERAPPRDLLQPGRGRGQSGQQRIDEIGEDRDRDRNGLERLEQEEDIAGEQDAEAERNPSCARREVGTRIEPQPGIQDRKAEHAADGRERQHIGAGIEHDLGQNVRAGERGGAEQSRADLRQTGARGGRRGHDEARCERGWETLMPL